MDEDADTPRTLIQRVIGNLTEHDDTVKLTFQARQDASKVQEYKSQNQFSHQLRKRRAIPKETPRTLIQDYIASHDPEETTKIARTRSVASPTPKGQYSTRKSLNKQAVLNYMKVGEQVDEDTPRTLIQNILHTGTEETPIEYSHKASNPEAKNIINAQPEEAMLLNVDEKTFMDEVQKNLIHRPSPQIRLSRSISKKWSPRRRYHSHNVTQPNEILSQYEMSSTEKASSILDNTTFYIPYEVSHIDATTSVENRSTGIINSSRQVNVLPTNIDMAEFSEGSNDISEVERVQKELAEKDILQHTLDFLSTDIQTDILNEKTGNTQKKDVTPEEAEKEVETNAPEVIQEQTSNASNGNHITVYDQQEDDDDQTGKNTDKRIVPGIIDINQERQNSDSDNNQLCESVHRHEKINNDVEVRNKRTGSNQKADNIDTVQDGDSKEKKNSLKAKDNSDVEDQQHGRSLEKSSDSEDIIPCVPTVQHLTVSDGVDDFVPDITPKLPLKQTKLTSLLVPIKSGAGILKGAVEYVPIKTPRLLLKQTKGTLLKTSTTIKLPTERKLKKSQRVLENENKNVRHKSGKAKQKAKENPPRISTAITKSIFSHFSTMKIKKETLTLVENVADIFWKNMVSDLVAFAGHGDRVIINKSDVELLIKRQGFLPEKRTLNGLIEKYLSDEYREQLIPIARAKNNLIPKQ